MHRSTLMKYAFLIPMTVAAVAANTHAQTPVFRCAGNVYTNDAAEARAKGCKTLEGGNVTVVQGTRVNPQASVKVATAQQAAAGPGQRVEADEQRARDSDA